MTLSINSPSAFTGNTAANLGATSSAITQTIANLVSQNTTVSQTASDTTAVTEAAAQQSQNSQLQATKSNVSLASSLTQTAAQSLSQELALVQQLRSLAAQASSSDITDTQRANLNTEYQAIEQQLAEQFPPGFNGITLSNYSTTLSQALGSNSNENTGPTLNIPGTSPQDLGIAGTDISTLAGAQSAQPALQTASDTLQSALANAGTFSQALDYASAVIETMDNNQAAAASTFGPDFLTEATQFSEQSILQQAQTATLAQANNIPATVLNLVNDPPVETGSAT